MTKHLLFVIYKHFVEDNEELYRSAQVSEVLAAMHVLSKYLQ